MIKIKKYQNAYIVNNLIYNLLKLKIIYFKNKIINKNLSENMNYLKS